MSSYVIPLFPAAAASPLPTRDALAAELSRLRDRVDASLPGKADKAPPAAPGNLASLGADGNLADSGATPASIKAAAVAEVVANAPGTMDTLREIADILGSSQESGTVLKRISDLESGKRGLTDLAVYEPAGAWDGTDGAQTHRFTLKSESPEVILWATSDDQTTAIRLTRWADDGGYWTLDVPGVGSGYLQRPGDALELEFEVSGAMWILTRGVEKTADGLAKTSQVPPAVAVDATLAVPGAAADAKAVGDALAGKLDGAAAYPEWDDMKDDYEVGDVISFGGKLYVSIHGGNGADTPPFDSVHWAETTLRSLIALKQAALSSSQLAAVDSGATAGKVATWDGYAAQILQKADAADLPYRLVTPGEWEFGSEGSYTMDGPHEALPGEPGTPYFWKLYLGAVWVDDSVSYESPYVLSVEFPIAQITATRASLPGHLLDRAGNRVVVTGDTTLTLPAAVPGHLRDFLVRLEISGSTVPTITFAAPTGETITYETDGDEFPVPDEAGSWLYSFTESCVAHKFAMSLKKVNTVAQGGA